jgi:hypothetical protein
VDRLAIPNGIPHGYDVGRGSRVSLRAGQVPTLQAALKSFNALAADRVHDAA